MTTLREKRVALGLTQTALAEKLDVSQETITMWENGARKPNIIYLKKLAHILGCTTDELLEPIKID